MKSWSEIIVAPATATAACNGYCFRPKYTEARTSVASSGDVDPATHVLIVTGDRK